MSSMSVVKQQSQNGWIEIGTLADIPKQGARVVRHPDGDIAVFRTADDALFALRDRCPHKGGLVSQGIVYGNKVACPLHDWKISLDTGLAVAPDAGCAARFPVKLEDGRVRLRNVRHDEMTKLKRAGEAKEINEDDRHHTEVDLQKITDKMMA